ncbi:MAG: amino acid permease, partial [Saprospiraceae bacterium]
GDFIAFLYGWAGFAVINTAGVASIAYVLGTYLEYFIQLPRLTPEAEKSIDVFIPLIGHIFPLENIGVKGVTILVVALLSYINSRSSKLSGNVSVVVTFLKIAAIVMVIFGLLFSGTGTLHNLVQSSSLISPKGWALLGALVAATSGAFWGYDGWNNIGFVAGEIDHPQRNIPRSLLAGVVTCIVIYVLINAAYLYMLPIDTLATSQMVASDAMKIAFGTIGGGIIALIVILSTFGTTHANILAPTRVSFAMAVDGKFFSSMGRIHPQYGTPANAIWIHCIWTSLLVISGSFDTLTDMLIFVSYLFYGMSAFGIFVLRKKMPETERPYKVWGYPFVPAIFVLFAAFFLIVTLFNDISNYMSGKSVLINSVFGILLTCIGIPLYWYFSSKKTNQPTS